MNHWFGVKGTPYTNDSPKSLSSNVTDSIEMTVIVDGVVNTDYTKVVYPQYNSTVPLQFEGTDDSTIEVQLNGNIYREYHIDFSTGNVTTTTYNFVPATEPVTTEPQYTEPTEEINPDYSGDDTNSGEDTESSDENY